MALGKALGEQTERTRIESPLIDEAHRADHPPLRTTLIDRNRQPSGEPKGASVKPTRCIESFRSSRDAYEMPRMRYRWSASAHKDVIMDRDRVGTWGPHKCRSTADWRWLVTKLYIASFFHIVTSKLTMSGTSYKLRLRTLETSI